MLFLNERSVIEYKIDVVNSNVLDEMSVSWKSFDTGANCEDIIGISNGLFYALSDENDVVGFIFFQFIEKCNNLVEMFMYSKSKLDFSRISNVLFDEIDKKEIDVFVIMFDSKDPSNTDDDYFNILLTRNARKMKKFGFCECGRINIRNDDHDLVILQRIKKNVILD